MAKASKDHTAKGEYDEQWKKYKTILRLGGRKAKFKAGVPLRIGQNGKVLTTSADIADDELAYFARTQAGVITSAEAATARYNKHSKDQFFSGELDMDAVMPMLVCRTQLATANAGTKGGPDGIINGVLRAGPQECADILHPLFVKAAIQMREPLAFKGGDMVGIPKGKGDERTLAAHREILLNNVFGKHHHKYIISVLNNVLGQVLEDVQTGGRPKRGADMAVLATRLFMDRAQAAGMSYMIGMYDLKEAFYSVVVSFCTNCQARRMSSKRSSRASTSQSGFGRNSSTSWGDQAS